MRLKITIELEDEGDAGRLATAQINSHGWAVEVEGVLYPADLYLLTEIVKLARAEKDRYK